MWCEHENSSRRSNLESVDLHHSIPSIISSDYVVSLGSLFVFNRIYSFQLHPVRFEKTSSLNFNGTLSLLNMNGVSFWFRVPWWNVSYNLPNIARMDRDFILCYAFVRYLKSLFVNSVKGYFFNPKNYCVSNKYNISTQVVLCCSPTYPLFNKLNYISLAPIISKLPNFAISFILQ